MRHFPVVQGRVNTITAFLPLVVRYSDFNMKWMGPLIVAQLQKHWSQVFPS